MKKGYQDPGARGRLRRLAVAFTVLVLGGCGVVFRTGRLPDTAKLDSLSKGTSTRDDVLRAFGPPKGTGRALFPHEERPRDVWSYYYEESTSSDSQRIFLFVLFDGERYTGSMWFSSLPLIHSGPLISLPTAAP